MNKIQIRRDTESNWTLVNPILADGEQGYETDTGKMKVGNGTDDYNTLSYFVDPSLLNLKADQTSLDSTNVIVGDNQSAITSNKNDITTLGTDKLDISVYDTRVLNDITDISAPTPGDGQRLAWDDTQLLWVPKTSTSGLGILQLSYEMELPFNPTPGAKKYSRDTNSGILGTPMTLYFNKIDRNNIDLTLMFEEMQSGQWLNIHEEQDVDNAELYDISGEPVLNGDVFEVPVIVYELKGNALVDKKKLKVFWRTISPDNRLPQGGLTGQSLIKTTDSDYDTKWANRLVDVVDDLTPQLGGVLETLDNDILITDGAGVIEGAIGKSIDGVFIAYTGADGIYTDTDGGVNLIPGTVELHGTTVEVQSLIGTEARQVYCSPGGHLYSVVPPAPGWVETDSDNGDYPLTTLNTWVEISGLIITVPQDIPTGDRLDFTVNLHVVNNTTRGGSIDISSGKNGSTPTSNGINARIEADFNNTIPISISLTNHGGYLTGDIITVWTRISTEDHQAFDPEVHGSSGAGHELTVSIPGEGGSGGEAIWGAITGTLSDQNDLITALNLKADQSDLTITNNNVSTNTSAIALNTDKISYTDASLVATHTTDISTNTSNISTNTSAIALNTDKTGITTQQANDITANNAKISYTDASLVATNTTNISTLQTEVDLNTAKISYTDGALVAQHSTDISNNTTLANTKEDDLNNPASDGQVLSSLIDGTRTWMDSPAPSVIDGGDAGPFPPPVFTGSISDISAEVGTAITPVDISSNFSTGGPVTSYSLTNNPTWMSIDNTGIISGTPDAEATTPSVFVTASNVDTSADSNTFNAIGDPLPMKFLAYATPDGVATSVDIEFKGRARINGVQYNWGVHTINTSGTTPIEIRNDGNLGEDLKDIRFITDAFTDVDIQNAKMLTSANNNDNYNGGMCYNLTKLTSFNILGSDNILTFLGAWTGCTSLSSFTAIDMSASTNFRNAWQNCTSLTTFPLIDTSSGTNFSTAWNNCSSLTSFPAIDTSKGTNFSNAWNNCLSLTSFPLIDTSQGTDFSDTWRQCTSLVCLTSVNTLSASNTGRIFLNCDNLVAPNSSDQTAIEAGMNWTNPGSCP